MMTQWETQGEKTLLSNEDDRDGQRSKVRLLLVDSEAATTQSDQSLEDRSVTVYRGQRPNQHDDALEK